MATQDSGLLSLTQLTPVKFDKGKLAEKIKQYEQRTGEVLDDECKKFKYVKFWDDGSFFLFNIYETYFQIGPSNCQWQAGWEYVCAICRILNIKTAYTFTNRNYKAYTRLTHSEFISMHDGYALIRKDVN